MSVINRRLDGRAGYENNNTVERDSRTSFYVARYSSTTIVLTVQRLKGFPMTSGSDGKPRSVSSSFYSPRTKYEQLRCMWYALVAARAQTGSNTNRPAPESESYIRLYYTVNRRL